MHAATRLAVSIAFLGALLAAALPASADAADGKAEPGTGRARLQLNQVVPVRWDAQRNRKRFRRRFSLELELGPVWQTRNDVAIPGNTGTRFALDDVTGAGPFPYGRITFDWRVSGRHNVRALIAPLEISETGVLSDPVSFAGQTYAAGVPTQATYKFNSYRLGYRYQLICKPCWSVFVGAMIKVRDANIELRQGATTSRKTDLGIVPLLHIDAEWRFRPGWRLVGDLDGAAAPQGRAFDFALKVHRDFSERWSVGVGYRTIEGGADNDKVYTFAWLHQAILSVSYRF